MRTQVTCTRCGNTTDKAIMIKVAKNNRGQRPSYICPACATEKHSYYTKNNELRGADTKHPFTYGMELETSDSNEKARSELYEYHFLPTHDSTVDTEYKSPIMNNLKSLSHLTKVIDNLIENDDMAIGTECGTHFHVGHANLDVTTMNYIRRFYQSLFVPLCEEMQRHPYETEQLFGRYFGYWSDTINMNSDWSEHTNFINVQHDKTIEFRIAFYQNGTQYMKVAKLATKITERVMNNFVAHFNDEPKDKTRYPNKTAYRRHKAQMTAQKIVKDYLKAINA